MEQNNTKIYICPMHQEIRQSGPGRCPKCGMALVPEGTQAQAATDDRGLGALTLRNYIPLIVIILLIALSSFVASHNNFRPGEFGSTLIFNFMTGFFLIFAGFKFLDLKGFAQGYFTYDLLAQRFFAYGYIYPFIELGFGLSMLAGIDSALLLWTEAVVMAFSGIGVAIKLAKREQFHCVCLGTFLKVPLTKITLMEDFGMAALALVLLFR